MDDEQIKHLLMLDKKERALSQIIVWLKAKGLWEDCNNDLQIVAGQVEPEVLLPKPNTTCEKFVVRLYDGFDNGWMDITEPITKEEAEKVWNEKTNNGKHHKSFNDIDYYAIFSADTKMLYEL